MRWVDACDSAKNWHVIEPDSVALREGFSSADLDYLAQITEPVWLADCRLLLT